MCTLFNDLEISFSDTQTVLAVHACSKRDKLDHFGVCSQALCYAVISHSTAWARFFSKLASDHTWLQAITVKGQLKAKAPGPIAPENARSILPQPVLLQVLRNLLCGRIRAPLRARVKDLGCAEAIMGGSGGLREMDLLQPAQFFLEMSADNGSAWSMASGDIQQYYDLVPPLSVMDSFRGLGFDTCLAAFAARLHVTPTVTLQAEEHEYFVSRRIRGLLTGSRSAALVALLPLVDCFSTIPEEIFQDALPLQPKPTPERLRQN
jgi:hypothetical protein